ncbi:5-formyltetrahydrofolate cyclo-ligase [Candidatus Woesearchaeota archaeon]|nr:5-formyltetrahydrofolate cyclo-ligase [Candidatus Woesearchaeota archaeon]
MKTVKQQIRETIREKRDAMTREEVESKSAAIAAKLQQLEEYAGAKTVLFYAAKGNEAQTKKLINDALKSGKKVLLPITNTAAGELEVAEIRDYSSDLKPGAFGIMEPKRRSAVDEEEIDVVIVPGVAFDKDGHRLGYGLGYYDKLLHRLAKAAEIGLAYDFQVVEKLPRESHDRPMDAIVTESRVIRCN